MWLSDLENNFQYLATSIWKSEDGGEISNRSTQFTGHYSVDIDPNDPGRMYASGLVLNRISVTVDPEDPDRIYASHFGSGVWSSPRP